MSSVNGQAPGPSSLSSSSSTSRLPDPQLPAPPLNEDEHGFTAAQLIERQAELEEAARQAVPFSYTTGGCTYERGYIRQPVYACRTCGGGGVCAGCSVGCHAEHDLVELFNKRDFRCDCGTLSLCRGNVIKERALAPCSLRGKELCFAPQNDDNRYDKNFDGIFCRCERGRVYDPLTEEETMLQCLCCEDWVHESCSSLRPSKMIDDYDRTDRALADGPLVEDDTFDQFICNDCMQKPENKALLPYLGARGWIICLPEQQAQVLPKQIDGIEAVSVIARGDGWQHPWKVYGLANGTVQAAQEQRGEAAVHEPAAQANLEEPTAATAVEEHAGTKRKAEETPTAADGDGEAKRAKTPSGLTVLDSFSDAEQDGSAVADGRDAPLIAPNDKTYSVGGDVCIEPDVPLFATARTKPPRLDVFLTEAFRERLCRCRTCLTAWTALPYVLTAEETYSPPRSHASSQHDGQSEAGASQTSSTYDLGLAALNRLPREQMLESMQAYSQMRDALFAHLRPFADQGKTVDAESVRAFFRKQKEQQDAARNGNL